MEMMMAPIYRNLSPRLPAMLSVRTLAGTTGFPSVTGDLGGVPAVGLGSGLWSDGGIEGFRVNLAGANGILGRSASLAGAFRSWNWGG